MLKGQKSEINDFMKQEDREVRLKVKSEIKDMLCLGRANKVAKGPNPKSILKKKKTHTHYTILHEFKLTLFKLFYTRKYFPNVITI